MTDEILEQAVDLEQVTPPVLPDAADETSEQIEEAVAEDGNEPDAPPGEYLVRSKPYATVHGTNEFRAKFRQDGEYFDAHGKRIPEMSMAGQDKRTIDGPTAAEEPSEPVTKPETITLAQQGDVNLQKWADKTQRYLWVNVQTAVEAATGTRPKNKDHAMELLSVHGVLLPTDPDESE